MSTAAGSLSEPQVLAHTKRRLFPDEDEDDAYAVVDTQFATEEWLSGIPVDPEIRESLAPFNHVQVGGGYPDLVGVRRLDNDLLAVDRLGDEPPLIAIEAKGFAGGNVDTKRGIVQAYDRLHEANAAYLAAPASIITQTDQTLARELNVGILGVRTDGDVDPIEVPRVVGNRTTTETNALRFQAGAQGVANKSFKLNHPKNYLGFVLAQYSDGDTGDLLAEYNVVREVEGAKQGAAFLGLVSDQPHGVDLTPLGQEVIRFARSHCGSVEAALEEFDDWFGSPKRFAELAPAWGQLARRVVYDYPATKLLVSELQTMHEDNPAPTLVDLVIQLHMLHPSFTVELFIKGDENVRSRVLANDGEIQKAALYDGNVYHAPTVYQLKTMLYHSGILLKNGNMPHKLDPTDDIWALREPV